MYFFYIDESGNRDVKKIDEPYVLSAVGMYENQWRGFNRHLAGMKTNIAREHNQDIRPDQLEVKANLLTKPRARLKHPFFSNLTEDNITHISTHYYDQLERSKMVVIAVVIDKEALREDTSGEYMHSKAYEMLLERIQHYIWNNHRKHNALIIMDDAGANLNRKIALMHARLLGVGNDNMDFRNIIEYPFFASSELSNGIQLADLVAYCFYHAFRYEKPEYEYLVRILPCIARHADDHRILAGLKIWPESERYATIFDTIQREENRSGAGR